MKIVLSNAIDVISGGTPNTSKAEYWNGGIGWLSVADFNNGDKKVYKSEKTISELGLKNSSTNMLNTGDIIISARGTVGALAQLGSNMCFNQSCFGLRGKKNIIKNDYLYYALKNYIKNIQTKTQGSVFATINIDTFKLIEINIEDDLCKQQKIADVLSALDDKIELNNKINAELEATAKDLYNYWFVQFDFPDENGRPYKSSGGKMVYNPILKREIPDGWTVERLKFLCDVTTGKEDASLATEKGLYAFFTCGDNVLRCDKAAFDGKAILVAGNGNFNVKYYEGKFNAYQRTYVLMPNNKKYFWPIYIGLLETTSKFIKGSNGSIVKFIKKGDIEDVSILLPKNLELLNVFNGCLTYIDRVKKENSYLSNLRDFLLPMLMNGQVSVG